MVDTDRGERGDVHAPARHNGRQRGAALDPQGSRRHLRRPAVGGRRLRADPRCACADGRLAGRQAGSPPAVRRRASDLLRGVAALRAGARSDLAQPGARAAGRRRRGDVCGLARPGRAGVPRRARARHRDGALRRHDRCRGGDRPARRRRAHRRVRVAVDLLSERPDRRRGARHHLPEAAREPRPQRDPRRWAGSRPSAALCSYSCWRWCAATTRAGAAP